MTVTTPRRLLLVSIPRSASNLLLKILDILNQPNVLTNSEAGYFFFPAFIPAMQGGYLDKPMDQWTDAMKQEVKASFNGCVERLEEFSARAEEEKKFMFTKEHAYWFINPAALHEMFTGTEDAKLYEAFRLRVAETYGPQSFSPANKTVLPDAYLRSWQLAFIIRHPALAWPSMYRAMAKISDIGGMGEKEIRGVWSTNMTLRWTRMVYDWALEQGTTPAILDADDVTHNPLAVTRFCELTGLDKETLKFQWSEEGTKESGPSVGNESAEALDMRLKINSIMRSTVDSSSGIIKNKTPSTIDLDVEIKSWKAEFGEEVAKLMEKSVLESMPDYEYLKARRVTG
ncbi:hypothetical protein BO94DRAFT_533811 [Aspergillus sclerotioniger CBS 115572]|uniref:Sulfotransferase family protein n=1 Tax=Aspergillus sclerotioniger CBS 115572 TaxID=1450535 RepID=A0A317WYG6_9EURO|nr:hypothetical protein BO94DRAFT_533811 [Aspergillus sclerotioniger CBS 115572]PWY90307.1 hypothetical protein BO94DRAFT_533811 [Aspergillus sclerotioniger CBS 115572]